MSESTSGATNRRSPLGRRNLLLLAGAAGSLVVGYSLLVAGSVSAAAVLLVVGYCVLFPLGIAL